MITYDKDFVAKYRAKAVTSVDDFIVGRTYYGCMDAKPFVLKELVTNAESYRRVGLEWGWNNGDEIAWFYQESGRCHSLRDCNIGGAYNPWLIFSDEETAKEYFAGLKLVCEPDPYDLWGDIDDSWWDDGSDPAKISQQTPL